MSLLATIIRFFENNRYHLPEETPLPVLVGVSGGTDSVALLHALVHLQPELSLQIEVAHLNHMLRGAEANADAAFVAGLCASLSVPCHLREREVAVLAEKWGTGIEEAARYARYSFFAEVMQELGIPLLLVAHNANDQAETVLMRLLRGTGLQGLAGMRPLATFPVAPSPELDTSNFLVGRPLLEVWRKELEQYCAEHKLQPQHDSTNTDQHYTRNRVRHELMPLLEENYQQGAAANLVRLSHLAADEQEWLEQLTRQNFDQLAHIETGVRSAEDGTVQPAQVISFPLRDWTLLPVALQRRLIRHTYLTLTGTLHNLQDSHIELILDNLAKSVWNMNLPDDIRVKIYAGALIFATTDLPVYNGFVLYDFKEEISLRPGETAAYFNWFFSSEILSSAEGIGYTDDNWQQFLDADKIGEVLLIRGRKPGEKFQPLGAPGRKKLQDYMVDVKIPRELRDLWPLVVRPTTVSGEEAKILWVAGYAIADEFKITPETKRVLRLSVEPV